MWNPLKPNLADGGERPSRQAASKTKSWFQSFYRDDGSEDGGSEDDIDFQEEQAGPAGPTPPVSAPRHAQAGGPAQNIVEPEVAGENGDSDDFASADDDDDAGDGQSEGDEAIMVEFEDANGEDGPEVLKALHRTFRDMEMQGFEDLRAHLQPSGVVLLLIRLQLLDWHLVQNLLLVLATLDMPSHV